MRGRILLIYFIVGIFLFIFSYINFYNLFLTPKFIIWVGEQDLSFFRVVFLQKKAADYINSNFSDDVIISKWPIYHAFRDPIYGYVNQKMRTLPCETEEDVNQVRNVLFNPEGKKVILITSTTYWADKCFRTFSPRFMKRIFSANFPEADKVEMYSLVYDK